MEVPRFYSGYHPAVPRTPLWAVAVVAAATSLSLAIALGTRGYVHPDERLHVEAFRYYASHVWPPDMNSDALVYDAYGTSKVYARESAYTLFGWLGRGPGVRPYRLLGVALLPLTLGLLLFRRSRLAPTQALGLVLAAVPQVLYVFGYANTDGWSVCVSVALFAFALRLSESGAPWTWAECAALGLLAGLLLATKDNFLFALALPLVLLVPQARSRATPGRLALVLVLAALPPAPYKVIYPSTQDDYAGASWRQSEQRAAPGFKPSDATPPVDVLRGFAVRTAQSAWGVYGHMNVFHAPAVYAGVAALAALNLGLTVRTARRRWSVLPVELRRLLLTAPCVILANLALSLRWSLEVFYQPQGRYLFPSLLPAALLLAGTVAHEDGERGVRLASAGLALGLCAWSLLTLALPRLA